MAFFALKIFGLSLSVCVLALLIPYLIGNDGEVFNPVQNLLENLFSQKRKEDAAGEGLLSESFDVVLAPILTSFMTGSIVYAILCILDIPFMIHSTFAYHKLMITHLLIGSIVLNLTLFIKGHPGIEILSIYSVGFSVALTICIILTGTKLAYIGVIMYLVLIVFWEVRYPATNLVARISFLITFFGPFPFYWISKIIWKDQSWEKELLPTGISNKILKFVFLLRFLLYVLVL